MGAITIYIASDHGGFELKKHLIRSLVSQIRFVDLGSNESESVDYPDYALKVCEALQKIYPPLPPEKDSLETKNLGVLICGTGQGMCMSANKFSWARASLCWDEKTTTLAREHNNANILCMGGRLITLDLGLHILNTFINTPFLGDRHSRRLQKMSKISSTKGIHS